MKLRFNDNGLMGFGMWMCIRVLLFAHALFSTKVSNPEESSHFSALVKAISVLSR